MTLKFHHLHEMCFKLPQLYYIYTCYRMAEDSYYQYKVDNICVTWYWLRGKA